MKFSLSAPAPRCPLCHEFMSTRFNHAIQALVFVCPADKVKIRVDDPHVNRWEEALHNATAGEGIECPMAKTARACKGKMRYFSTKTGYMKAVCPERGCGASISKGGTHVEGTTEDTTPDNLGVVQ